MAAPYIKASNVTDEQLKPLIDEAHLSLTRGYIETLAKRRGLDVTDIADPLPELALQLAVAYLCMITARDKSGRNPQHLHNDVELDIYMVKYKMWRDEFNRLEPQVTAEVLSDEADEPRHFSKSIDIFRR